MTQEEIDRNDASSEFLIGEVQKAETALSKLLREMRWATCGSEPVKEGHLRDLSWVMETLFDAYYEHTGEALNFSPIRASDTSIGYRAGEVG